ncbi:Uncharacterised protein [Mycobacterium tuberculosis]|nr:Uncharacterised protein [Mycobacterium tuberculosis]
MKRAISSDRQVREPLAQLCANRADQLAQAGYGDDGLVVVQAQLRLSIGISNDVSLGDARASLERFCQPLYAVILDVVHVWKDQG